MVRHNIDDQVVRTIREFGRPVRFSEIADTLQTTGTSRSQVHNAIYRLGKRGRLHREGKGSAMTYTVVVDS